MEEQNNNNININSNNNNKLKRDGIIVILVICILFVTAAMIVVFGTQGEGRASLIKKIFNTEKVQEVEEPKETEEQPEEQIPEQNEVVEEEKKETKTEEKTTKKSDKTNKTTNSSSSTTNKPSSGGSSGSSSGGSSGTTKPQGEKVVLYAFLDSDFLPKDKITRGEFAKWLVRVNNNPLKNTTNEKIPFTDVPSNHKYYKYIVTAFLMGYMSGRDVGVFDPNGYLTRAEVVTSVLKAMELNGIPIGESCEDKDYSDVSPKKWYYKPIHRGTKACIINGHDDGTFRPDDVIDKGHTFIIFYKAFNHSHKLYKTCDDINEANPFATSVAGDEKYNLYLESYFTHNCYK